jgi:TonB-dependent receptor
MGMNDIRLRRAVGAVLAAALVTGGIGIPALAQDEAAADQGVMLEEITVTGRQRTAAESVLLERIESRVVADLVGIEQISRVGDSTVSLALRRLPGVTVVGDQFIYIRGLGERYSSTTINGAYVPSPDLTRNVVPLDLFPAEIVQSLAVQKGYSVDKSAAFGGGNVDIRTRSVPDDLQFSLQLGTGWNSEGSSDGLSYSGGSDDDLGTDDGTRALPAAISQAIQDYQGNITANGIFTALQRDGEFHSFAEAEQINRELATSLNRTLDPRKESLSPDLSLELSAGNSWYLGETEQWKVGVLALGDYKNQWRNRERINRSASLPDEDVDVTQRTTHQVVLTGSLGLGVNFADEQTIEATGIFLRNTEDDASITTGSNFNFRVEDGRQLRNYRVRYEERELELLQLRGSHRLGPETLALLEGFLNLSGLEDLGFDWYWSDATALTDIPSEVLFSGQDSVDPLTGEVLSTAMRLSASSAEYRFTDLEDSATSYGTKLSFPVRLGGTEILLSGGYDYYEKGRSYLQTQLGIGSTTAPASVLQGTPSEVFTDANILDPANRFGLTIGGIGTESYLAGEVVTATFGNVDFNWNDVLRLSAGVRWENFERLALPIDPISFDTTTSKIRLPPGQTLKTAASSSDDYYPALALTWSRPDFWADDFQLRFGWSETVARPDLREISAATYIDPLTEARVLGEPGLLNSDLSNFDLRAEWFFAGGDNLTVSLFYKDISNPIETVEGAGTDDNVSLTFINGEAAEVYGIEVEGLKSLGFLSNGGWTEAFFVSGNVTVSDSEITIGSAAPGLTNNTRRLTQHSPLVINLQLGYDSPAGGHSASLVYGMYDERVFFAGRGGAQDALEQPFHSLDVVYTWYPTDRLNLKLRAQNILDAKTEIEQGGVTVLEQSIGTTLKLDLTYKF